MNRSHLRFNLTLLAVLVALSLLASSHSIAQDATCTLSGRVVDMEGNPFVNISIAIQSFVVVDGWLGSAHLLKDFMPEAYTPPLISHTDAAGRFSLTGIRPGPIQFVARPAYLPGDESPSSDLAPDAEVLSVEIGAITFYPLYYKHPPFGGLTFVVEPGVHLENVEVKVKPRMRIRGQIVFADGTPLANAEIRTSTKQRDLDGRGNSSSSGGSRTDDAGYFVEYVDSPGLYTVTIGFQRFSVTSGEFILETDQRYDSLVFTLDSKPVPFEALPEQMELDNTGQWVLNPANNHSYKRVHCESWDDAQVKAVAEDAHLVAINDAAEQEWLVKIFGTAPCWIGLTDTVEEGKWVWTSGEPLAYFNWAFHKLIDAERGDEDYVFMGLSPDGRWHKVGPQSPEWQMPRMTILEKEVSPAEMSVEDK